MGARVVQRWPLSFQQRGHLERERDRARTPYGPTVALAARDAVEPARVLSALADVMKRHAALRAAIDQRSGTMEVLDEVPVRLDVERAIPSTALPEMIARHRQTMFDRMSPPLWSCRLLVTDAGRQVLSFTFDHLIFDRASQDIFFADLASAATPRAGRDDAVPRSYGQFSRWQAEVFESAYACHIEALDFWREHLRGIPVNRPVPLPFCLDPTGALSGQTAEISLEVDPATATAVAAAARRLRVTQYMLIMAALAAVLVKLSGEPDLSIRIPVLGRPGGFEDCIGWFSNDVIVRLRCAHAKELEDFVVEVRRSFVSVMDHQVTPYELVRNCVERHRLITDHRPPMVILNAIDPQRPLRAFGTTLESILTRGGGHEPGLHITLSSQPGKVIIGCLFDPARFIQGDVSALLESMVALLQSYVSAERPAALP